MSEQNDIIRQGMSKFKPLDDSVRPFERKAFADESGTYQGGCICMNFWEAHTL